MGAGVGAVTSHSTTVAASTTATATAALTPTEPGAAAAAATAPAGSGAATQAAGDSTGVDVAQWAAELEAARKLAADRLNELNEAHARLVATVRETEELRAKAAVCDSMCADMRCA